MPHFLHKIDNSTLILGAGIEISITQISQSLTYKNQLEGIPSPEDNLKIIKQAAKTLKSFTELEEIFIIKPVMVSIPLEIRMPYDEATETLPKIICMIKVKHDNAFRNKAMHYSELGILWFQNEFAFPVDPQVLEQMKELPFAEACGEFQYLL